LGFESHIGVRLKGYRLKTPWYKLNPDYTGQKMEFKHIQSSLEQKILNTQKA
jgi:hypothetical protein